MSKEPLEEKLEKKAEAWSESCCKDKKWQNSNANAAGGGAVYGIGLIGALFYFLGNATSFGTVIMGILKSLVWPAMMVYHLFGLLKI